MTAPRTIGRRPSVLLLAVLIPAALTVSCTRYVDAEPIASPDLLSAAQGAAAETDASDCTPVDAPLTELESFGDDEPVLRIPQPPGWERYTKMDSELIRFTMGNVDLASDNFAPTVVVTLESQPGFEEPAVVFDAQRDALENGFGATDVTVTELEHCGLPAEFIEYTTPPISVAGALPAQVLMVVLHTDDRTFAATVTSQTADPYNPVYQDDTAEILGGFQMLSPAPG